MGAHGNVTGNAWQPIAPTSATAPTITHPKSYICENRRLGTGSFSRSLFICHIFQPKLAMPTFLFIPSPITQCEHLSVRLQVRCPLASSQTCISPFNCSLSGYRCIARSLHLWRASLLTTAICPATGALLAHCLSDAHLSFPLLSLWLQVHCPLSTSTMRISPFHR